MDVADECLKRQGRGIDDPQHEVSMMFIKHCPDRALASVFKFKSAEKWTASEIQERNFRTDCSVWDTYTSYTTDYWGVFPLVTGSEIALSNLHMCFGLTTDLFEDTCAKAPKGSRVVIQAAQKLQAFSELFYSPVLINHSVQLKGMLDSGSMACSISDQAVEKLSSAGILPEKQHPQESIILVGCGGLQTKPDGFFQLEMEVFGISCSVPTLVVPGQHDDLILGSNVIKHIMHVLKQDEKYRGNALKNDSDPEIGQFLSMFTNVEHWRGEEVPDKIGTVKLTQAVTLLPRHEHLIWGKLPVKVPMSPGSTVLVEPTSSRAAPRGALVGRLITPLWGDRWVPLTVVNPSDKPLMLKKNSKLADVSPCLAVEDFDVFQGLHMAVEDQQKYSQQQLRQLSATNSNNVSLESLCDMGLGAIDLDLCEVSESCKSQLIKLLMEYRDIFSKDSLDCGRVHGYTHRIRLTDDRPFRLPYRRVPPAHYEKLRLALTEMEEKGIIRKSSSDYASPLVMVWKKDGGLRICNDFRWLNARTVKDAHPLPHQSDCLAALGGNCIFSTMDLTSGFFNIPMHEHDKKYTAFTTPLGLYEYNCMPQGLCNSPASFMRMMVGIFGDMNFTKLLCYLDDLLVFAPSEDEALLRLQVVFQRLRENNLKLAPKKCHLMRRRVRFLGHVIDGNGVSVDPDKVEVISKMTPSDLMEDKSFLAGQKRRGRMAKDRKLQGVYRKLIPNDWTEGCEQAFHKLKTMLLECVMLAHPDFDEPFILSVDASLDGLGAVLSQVPRGQTKARPVAFASKTLSASQRKYPAHRLEFMALKWSVCEKFSHWLKGRHFTIWTDNNPLTYLLTKPKLDACEIRWVSKLASYSFDLKHLAGRKNVVADALSRDPFATPISHRLLEESYLSLTQEADRVDEDRVQSAFKFSCQPEHDKSRDYPSLKVVYDSAEIQALCQSHCDWISGAESRALQLTQQTQHMQCGQGEFPVLSIQELQSSQEQDAVISKVLPFVATRTRPSKRERRCSDIKVVRMLNQWDKLEIRDGVMYRVTKNPVTKQKRFQFVLPQCLRDKALSGIHDLAGHQGQDRTLSLARQSFYWPDMEKDVQRIHSDQGTNFESKLIAELLQLAGVAKSHTTAYHPMGNGVTERFNRTLGSMLRTLPLKEKQRWPEQIQTLTFVYNATVHETTGYAPFYLMFGRIPRLPVDVLFKPVLNDPAFADYDSYVKTLFSSLRNAVEIAQKHSLTEQQHQSSQYNKRTKGTHLSVGDRVLVANKGERGKRKLADRSDNEGTTDFSVNSDGLGYSTVNSGDGSLSFPGDSLLDVDVTDVSCSTTPVLSGVPELQTQSQSDSDEHGSLTLPAPAASLNEGMYI
ncbi:uncharacterized protein LOC119774555 [Cyprinodon tularosa]|uniref:uncharacterized protein LOC119774555 n=1 Tax=Cyprinodon tularosa TaxID=77115 RepID=UPI0018E240A7|nr:uncharacterized protein LOC119774555 [Cyprinodon tularosa]